MRPGDEFALVDGTMVRVIAAYGDRVRVNSVDCPSDVRMVWAEDID